ncbi:expressed unknown protein [Seminavis robusta]|uniref:Uncharacterized protein n=1 Tax=Seminavis robusta TaxID=568900 RepID=A0A9N8DPK2_9STRA|nr:expressed unknown protein [Seminavis robusta]|eukprot:Sro266_g103010.1 n/a (313) ;mRNA; r:9539-10891
MASKVQTAIATASVLHDLESGQLPNLANERRENEWFPQFGIVTLLTLALGAVSITFNILSILFVGTSVVYVAGIVAILVAPIVMKNQMEMEDKGGLRRVHNRLRENVNVLSSENTKLCGHVNDLVKQVKSLKHVEEELGTIAQENEQDVETLVKLVKENGEITKAITKATKAQAVAQIVDVFLDSDRDESSSLDEKEIQMLSYRLGNLHGIQVNQELFQQKAKEDSSMPGILAILHASFKADVEPDDKVFVIFEEDESGENAEDESPENGEDEYAEQKEDESGEKEGYGSPEMAEVGSPEEAEDEAAKQEED